MCCPSFIFESLLDVSNCDGSWFLLWKIAMAWSQILQQSCIGVMNLFSYILPVLYNFCWLCFTEIASKPWTVPKGTAHFFLASASLLYFLSLMVSAVSLCLAVSKASDYFWFWMFPSYFLIIQMLFLFFASFL